MRFVATILVLATSFGTGYLYYKSVAPKITQAKFCPIGSGHYMLPRTFTGKSLFVGYTEDPTYVTFVNEVIQSVVDQKLDIDVNILIPKDDFKEAFTSLAKLRAKPYKSFVKLVSTSSTEALWVQDYIEHAVDLDSLEDVLIELPYWDRDGSIMPKILSIFKGWDLVESPTSYPEGEIHTDADYGGGIEALPYNLILIGESMATSLKKHLNKILPNQKLLEVPTQWVENKHVDEIFTLLPTPSSSCGFAIGYASPELAMELMSDSADEAFWEITRDETSANNYNFDHCASSKSYLECPELIKANQAYQAEIERALVVIKDSLAKHCVDLKLIPLPQLFMPQKVFADYGTISDEARALNPSVVNSLLVGRHIFYSYQVFEPFGNYVEKTFSSLGLLPKPLESNSLQSSGGGFHCSSLMTNSCVK